MASTTAVSANPDLTEQAYTRLHISPFNPALFSSVIPAALQSSVCNISYHSIQTFPDKGYGYLDLPTMEAQKVKKKLHGSILKGSKMRLEDARPAKGLEVEAEAELPKRGPKKTSGLKRDPKRAQETILAAELRDRKVKRGWTDPSPARKSMKRSEDKTEKKEGVRSKYTNDVECLFKAKVPPNMAGPVVDSGSSDRKRRRSHGKPGETVVVHEFEKTTKYPTFLKENNVRSSGKEALEFVDDQGWTDQEGNVIEAVRAKRTQTKSTTDSSSLLRVPPLSDSAVIRQVADTADGDTSTRSIPATVSLSTSGPAAELEGSEGTSASETSSDEESGSSDSSKSTSSTITSPNTISQETTTQRLETNSGSMPNLKIMVPPVHEVHPLEALYKRRQADNSTAAMSIDRSQQSFNFFGDDVIEDDEDDDDGAAAIPMTPYTQHDFSSRNIRSAAPTPDTAHPDKNYFNWPDERDDVDDEVDRDVGSKDDAQTPSRSKAVSKGDDTAAGVTDFSKWFYENRGDLNRSWKKRRKTAAKDKRQRENRKRGEQRT